jgi:hypothetical protein
VRRAVPLYAVGKLLCDKNPAVVQRYAKLSPEHLATEVDRLAFPAPKPDATVTSIGVARTIASGRSESSQSREGRRRAGRRHLPT